MWLENIKPIFLFRRVSSSIHALVDALFISKTRSKHQNQKKIGQTYGFSASCDPRQLLVDVSIISQNDAHTGIQRVVRALVNQLLSDQTPNGYIVRTIAATRKSPYRIVDWPNKPDTEHTTHEINIQPGDIFLGLDLCTRIVPAQYKQLAEWQRCGANLNFVVYDLLPLQHPQWFTAKTVAYFQNWLRTLVVLADQILCISPQVAQDFNEYTVERFRLNPHWLPVQVIPMGHDIAASRPSQGVPENFERLLEQFRHPNTILMVGTLEPRKGHTQVLEAFEHLWQLDNDYRLVIVGRPGWKTETLQARLKRHQELNHRLFWFDNASDEMLDQIYRTAQGIIIASWAEGYGLPLIEALGYGKPILARDIPVFHQLAHPNITFFNVQSGVGLATSINDWLFQLEKDRDSHRSTPFTPPATWQQATSTLWAIMQNQIIKTELPDTADIHRVRGIC